MTWPREVHPEIRVYAEETPIMGADGWRKYDGDGEPIYWSLSAELKCVSIRHRAGKTPSQAVLEICGKDTDPLRPAGGYVAGTGLDANGAGQGAIVRPAACHLMEQVKIVKVTPAVDEDPEVETELFRGIVTDIIPDWATERTQVVVSDWRWLLARTPILGWTYFYQVGEVDQHEFLLESLPIFNQGGRPDKYDGDDVATYPASICGPDHEDGAPWTRGDIWNGLRHHYQEEVPEDGGGDQLIPATSHYLDWPAVAAAGHGGGLFGSAIWQNLALGGKCLDQALELLLRQRAGYDWWVRPAAGEEELSVLELFGTAPGTIEGAQSHVTLKRGTPYLSPKDSERDVLAGSPAWNADKVALEIVGLGAKKKFDLTFDTVAGTLIVDWDAIQEEAWCLLTPAEKRKQYRNVFSRYIVPEDLDWVTEFGWAANVLRKRLAGTTLLSFDEATFGADGRPVRLRAQVWRSTSGGEPYTWEEISQEYGGCTPVANGLGIELAGAAREKFWSWDGNLETPTAHEIRITITVEADERLSPAASAISGAYWPRIQRLLLDEQFEYQARREAHMNADGDPLAPVLDGGTDTLFGDGNDDPIRDDGAKLAEAMGDMIDQLGRLGRSGAIKVSGLRTDLVPGVVLDDVTGGGADRPSEPFDTVIRGVDWDLGMHPTTTIHLEAD